MSATKKVKAIGISSDSNLIHVEGVAYSGGKIRVGSWSHAVVIDLAGITIPAEIPMLTDHENRTACRVGITSTVNDGRSISFSGKIFKSNADAQGIIAQLNEGADWQISIGAEVEEKELVEEGDKREVNGAEHEGPFYHIVKSTLREISIVSVGADVNTRMKKVAASFVLSIKGENQMPEDTKPGAEKPGYEKEEAGKLDKILALLEKLVSALQPPAPTESTAKPVEMKAFAENTVKIAALSGEVDALKAKHAEIEKKNSVAKLVEGAKKKLAAWHIDDDVNASLSKFAASGEDMLNAYVDSFMKNTPKEPPKSPEEMGVNGSMAGDPDEVVAFAAKGPEALEKARVASRDFDDAKGRGMKMMMSRKRFIEATLANQETTK